MTLDEIYLNIQNVSFKDIVNQMQVQTQKDKEKFNQNRYMIPFTEEEFKKVFPEIDPACVQYIPSISQSSLYFNFKTLAAAPMHLEYLALEDKENFKEGILRAINHREDEVKNKKFTGSFVALPSAMRLEYVELLIKTYSDLPNLYSLFFDIYECSDYGFSNISCDLFKSVFKSKTDEDRENTRKQLEGVPDIVTVYRGGNTKSVPYNKAYSWTLDINVANFFACRRGMGPGYVVKGRVKKSDILEAFLRGGNEKEVIVCPDKIEIEEVLDIKGLDFLENALPKVTKLYHKYRNDLLELEFLKEIGEHDKLHEARVLILSLVLADLLKLPMSDKRVLAMAAIYHDTRRNNDGDDKLHGLEARKKYEVESKSQNPIVSFLLEYHSRPDEEGFAEIKSNRVLSKNRTKVELLFKIFKDADALDRVRMGLRELDMNYLRLAESKTLTLVARIFLEQIKL